MKKIRDSFFFLQTEGSIGGVEGHTQPPEDQAEEPALKKQRTVGYGILSDYVNNGY